MAQTYSQRNRPRTSVLRYDLPNQVRKRIFLALEQTGDSQELMQFDLGQLLAELRDKLMAQYGDLYRPAYEAADQSANPVINHFLCCNDVMALDFVELWFKCWAYRPA